MTSFTNNNILSFPQVFHTFCTAICLLGSNHIYIYIYNVNIHMHIWQNEIKTNNQPYGHVYFVLHQTRTIHGKVLKLQFVKRGGTIFCEGDLSIRVWIGFRGSSAEDYFISIRSDDKDGRKWCETPLQWLHTSYTTKKHRFKSKLARGKKTKSVTSYRRGEVRSVD